MGHPGPGYSLGFNPAQQLIEGLLPDGNYTLQAVSNGQQGSTGFLNFSVGGGPRETPPMYLVPNISVIVAVKEDIKSGASVFVELDNGSAQSVRRRRTNLQVMLTYIEEFGSGERAVSQQPEGTQEPVLVVENVRPGRYHVHVETPVGYVASILSGETDLLHQPLVVALGGSVPPIEVMVRDDGADVDGKVDDETTCYVYFLPLIDSSGQFRQVTSSPDGSFSLAQVPPGGYRVLAFDRPQPDLVYSDADAMRKLESKGQLIQVDAGQKEHLRLKSIAGAESQ
jgi:hypothetical protein